MNRKKRERLAKQLQDAAADVDAAVEGMTGNPNVQDAIIAIKQRQDAIVEALNLDISVSSE